MAQRTITRTIKSTTFTVLGLNLQTLEKSEIQVTRTGTVDPAKFMDELRRAYVGRFAPAVVTSETTTEELYGMPEELFMKYATKVERGSKEE